MHINCSNNQIEIIPKEIGNLIHLTWLLLQCNHIKIIPKEINNLKSLEKISLWSNKLIISLAFISNNYTEVNSYFNIVNNVINMIAMLKIQAFLSQKVIPKYYANSDTVDIFI